MKFSLRVCLLVLTASVAWTSGIGAGGPEEPEPQVILGGGAQEIGADCTGCPEMVALPGGRFTMGSPIGRDGNQPPRHWVTVKPFAIGKYEVTWDEWELCVSEGGCNGELTSLVNRTLGWPRWRWPVIGVGWHGAQNFVRWLSARTGKTYRLPTEAEWEYAARAGTTSFYFWGNEAPVCNAAAPNGAANHCSNPGTRIVGTFQPNSFGLHDMHGNVSEWVEDCYFAVHVLVNEKGTLEDWLCQWKALRSLHVVCGGAWSSKFLGMLRSDGRKGYPARGRSTYIGFRVARER